LGAAHYKEPDLSGNFDDTKYVWYKKKKVCDLGVANGLSKNLGLAKF